MNDNEAFRVVKAAAVTLAVSARRAGDRDYADMLDEAVDQLNREDREVGFTPAIPYRP